MKRFICRLLGHNYVPENEAGLLRSLILNPDARFCIRCGHIDRDNAHKGRNGGQ